MPLTVNPSQTSSELSRHTAGFQLARLLLAGILIVAAALKCFAFVRGDQPWLWALRPALAQILLIEAELLIGFWLMSGLWPRASYWAALVIFSCFLIVSGYEVLARAQSCGCFGPVPVNPKATVALDVLALATLVLGRKVLPGSRGISGAQRWLSILVGGACMVAAAALMVRRDSVADRGGLVVLRPGDWIGKSFPLEKYLSDEGRLRQGKWLVLLYRHDCPVCETAMPEYIKLGRRLSGDLGKPVRMAFVEVPPAGSSASSKNERCCYWYGLSEGKMWTGATPIVLMLRDGRVELEKQGEDAVIPPASAEQWMRSSD